MKGLILYFSATGNTKFVALEIKKYFKTKGIEMDIHSTEEDFIIKDDYYDFMILGSPKHYEYTPCFFINWMATNLPIFKKPTPTIQYLTGVAPTKTSFNLSESILKDKNCNLVISKTIRMPNNYLIGFFKETTTLDCKLYTFNALKESKQIVDSFLNGNYSIEKVSPPLAFLCRKTNEFYGKRTKKAGVHFSVNDTCIECGICIKSCPTQNISFDGNKIIFKDSCIMCTRCANICPQNSIIYKDKKPAQYKYHIGKIL